MYMSIIVINMYLKKIARICTVAYIALLLTSLFMGIADVAITMLFFLIAIILFYGLCCLVYKSDISIDEDHSFGGLAFAICFVAVMGGGVSFLGEYFLSAAERLYIIF